MSKEIQGDAEQNTSIPSSESKATSELSAVRTRSLIKTEMRGAGWRRTGVGERPADGATILVAQEWVDRRFGTTDQFLTSCGQYHAATDAVECGDDGFIRAVHLFRKFHWWMPVFSPSDIGLIDLYVRDSFLGMAANASGYGSAASSL